MVIMSNGHYAEIPLHRMVIIPKINLACPITSSGRYTEKLLYHYIFGIMGLRFRINENLEKAISYPSVYERILGISLIWPIKSGQFSFNFLLFYDIIYMTNDLTYLATDITDLATDITHLATGITYLATVSWPDK